MLKTRFYKIMSWLLSVCLLAALALPVTARADGPSPVLYVGNTNVTPEAGDTVYYWKASGETNPAYENTGTQGDYLFSVAYTAAVGFTLTMNDMEINSYNSYPGYPCGISAADAGLHLVLNGEVTVGTDESKPRYGIHAAQAVSISDGTDAGESRLAITSSSNGDLSYGIHAGGDVTIGSGEIAITARCNGEVGARGINAGNITISGGNISVTTEGTMSANGIHAAGNITISGGNISAAASGIFSYGMDAGGNITISSGNISAAASGISSHGIHTAGDITISGGTVTAKGATRAMTKAPDLNDYPESYATTASENAAGSPAVSYVPANIITYKYFHITSLYDVWVGDTQVSGDNMANVLGDAGTPTVVYTPAVGTSGSDGYVPQTLTLSGATVNTAYTDGSGHKYGVYAQGHLNLVLADGSTNLIAGSALDISGSCTSYGFHVAETLTISGAGTLTASAGSVVGENIKSYGIRANNLIISSGTVNAFGGAVTNSTTNAYSIGIHATGNITINNGTVTAEGGAASGTDARSYGIFGGTIIINGGTVTARSASAPTTSRALISGILNLSGYGNASVTASIYSSGSDAGPFVPANIATYKYLLIRPKSATPAASVSSVAKTAATQASVSFTLTNSPAYANGQTWTVYTSADGSEEASGVSAANTGNTLTLSHASDLPAGTYYVSVTETGKAESDRLALAVTAYTPPSGGGSAPSTPTYTADVKAGDGSTAMLPITVDKATGTASIDTGAQKSISGGAVVTIPGVPDAHTYSVGIPIPNLSTTDMQGSLTVETEKGSVTVPSNMLTGVDGTDGSKAQISIGDGDKEGLSEELKAALGNKPLIRLTLSVDGRQTNWNNPTAPVTVSIPYTPTSEELLSPESIVVWYIDGSGNVITIPNGHYHAATGTVIVSLTHFSNYAVAYNKLGFNDVSASAWYNKAVSFIAARGITTGTGGGNFSPEAKLTRGQFIVLMMRAYGIAPDTSSTDNFSDAGNTWYTGYLAAAKRLGITAGVGSNMYAPDNQITRQEMFTLLYNTLKAIGQLPQGDSGKTLSDFTDARQIDTWAKDAMAALVETGIISGSNGALTPTGAATRAEMAQMLYHLLGM